jgi:hypothetical protein
MVHRKTGNTYFIVEESSSSLDEDFLDFYNKD